MQPQISPFISSMTIFGCSAGIALEILCVVYRFQKDNQYHPYPLFQVRHIAYQLIKAVKCKFGLLVGMGWF